MQHIEELNASDAILFRGKSYRACKQFWHGTQRTISPQETLERIRPHFKIVGLSRLSNITGLDRIGIPTTLAIRPNSPTISNCSGKGFTLEAAMVSGAMEAIEVYHVEGIQLPEIHLPYKQLSADYQVISLENLPLTKHSLFHVGWPCDWVMGWDIVNQNEVAVPIGIIDMVRGRKRISDLRFFQLSSNGLASGNDFLEAVNAALLEVIERDAVACHRVAWETCGYPPPIVQLQTIEHPLVLELLARFKAAQVAPMIFDCTVDTEIPVYMAYIYDLASRHFGIFEGYGAHLDPEIAMIRALTEAAQTRLICITGSRDDFFRHDYLHVKKGDSNEAISAISAIRALTPNVDARERKSQATPTFEGDIHLALRKLRKTGLHQVIIFELTRPSFPIHVVKVIVPGLEGCMFEFYAPGYRAKSFCRGKQT